MKLRKAIIDLINTPQKRNLIGIELGVGEQMVAIHIRKNKTNGALTKMNAVEAIAKVAGVSTEDVLEKNHELESATK